MEESKQIATAEVDEKKVSEFRPNPAFSTALVPKNVADAMNFATILSKSGVVPKDMIGKPEACFVAIGFGMELGLPPLQAVQNIMVVNGRPTLWGDAAMALVLGSGLCEVFDESPADEALKQGFGRCRIKRNGRIVEIKFTVEDAKKAGLWTKPGPWQQYPGRMLQMRARSWAMRDSCPDVLKGMRIREEVEDYEILPSDPVPSPTRASDTYHQKTGEVIDATPAAADDMPGDAQEPVEEFITQEERKELFAEITKAKIPIELTQKHLAETYKITSSAQLPKSKLGEFQAWIVANAKA